MRFFSGGPPGPGQRASPSPDGSQSSLPPRFDDPSGYERQSYDQHEGGAYVTVFRPSTPLFAVRPSPSDTLALNNCLIVHPSDFKDGVHVLVNGDFPLTVKCVTSIPHLGANLNASPDTTTLAAFLQVL